MAILEITLWLLGIIIFIPTSMWIFEVILGLSKSSPKTNITSTPKTSIIIPAHNEEDVIEDTLTNLCEQMTSNMEAIVVADNCSDNTADIARRFPVRVCERSDIKNRGKGYALSFGLEKVRDSSPEVIVIMDADCLLEQGALSELVSHCAQHNTPVQSQYLIKAAKNASVGTRISEFAVLIKNHIRLHGLNKMGSFVPLTGTGMAFPYETISGASLASGEIVEDMKLGIDLAIQNHGANYLPSSTVYSYFPSTPEALAKQRERWEHGHLGLIQKYFLMLVRSILSTKRKDLLLFSLDLFIPPIALLVLLNIIMFIISGVFGFLSSNYTLFISSLLTNLAFATCILLTWFLKGRHIVSTSDLLGMPSYIFSKFFSYKKFFKSRETEWVKTSRKK